MKKTKKLSRNYFDALQYVIVKERISLSMLQRKFQINYIEALTLYDRLVNDVRITKNSAVKIFPKPDFY